MPSESIPEDERLALARALRHVSEEDSPQRTPENEEEIARLFGDEQDSGEDGEPEVKSVTRPKFRLLHLLIGLLVLACLALVVPLAMDFLGGEDSGEVPVIQAEPQPDKVRPDEPGGLQVPHQDLQVLNQGGEGAGREPEQLLPPPETPEPLPQATQDTANLGAAPAVPAETPPSTAAEDTTAASVVPGAGAPAVSEPAAPAEVAEVPAAAPAEITGGPGASEAPEAPAAPTASGPAATAPAPEAPAPVETAAPEPEAAEPPAPAESQQAALPPAAEPAPAAGEAGIYIQLGSLSNREGVPKEWARLQKAFPDFLGDMELAVQTVTLEGRGTFHRIQAGPLPNRGTAEEMCAFLKNAEQACIVIKR
ncbi:MAG: SPOR domain-containing protein [Kiloniellales bacterium]|nr:SPOR domain-containing protein [Kiloniellales bacterium]